MENLEKVGRSSVSERSWLTVLLFLIIALDVGLLLFALGEPFGGFHGFQEAGYAAIARNYFSHSLLMPTDYDNATVGLGVPPLLSYLVFASFSVFGQTELAARLVPAAFAVASIAAVCLLSGELLGKHTGLEAAALYASSPIFLILGRNVMADIIYLPLSLFSVYFYVRARRTGKLREMAAAGVLLGLAMLAKQFAILPVAAIILWEVLEKNWRRLFKGDFILFLVLGGLFIGSFYGYHLLRDPAAALDSQLRGSASKASLPSGFMLSFIISEMFWGCSPLFLAGALAGLALMLRNRSHAKLLIALLIGCFSLFYLILHRHSYYFFGMTPFLAMSFTELSTRMSRRLYSSLLGVALGTAFLLSAYQLIGCKYGFGEMEQVGKLLRGYERPVVLVDESFYLNYRPLFYYYAENAALLLRGSRSSQEGRQLLRSSDRVFSFSALPLAGPQSDVTPVARTQCGLKLGDAVYVHNPPNPHFFTPAFPVRADAFELIRSFGPFVKIETISFFLISEPEI